MEICLIGAMDRQNVIGKRGHIPWHLPADLVHFKHTTMGKPLVMGRKTHMSIGRALPGRRNIVLSRSARWVPADGCESVSGVDEAMDLLQDEAVVMVIGGQTVYAAFLAQATRLHLTMVDTQVVEGDAWFPTFDPGEWQEIARADHEPDEANRFAMSFRELVRSRNLSRKDLR